MTSPTGMRATRWAAAVALAIALATGTVVAAAGGPRPAPDATLRLLSGRDLRLSTLRGTAVVLLFWAPW